MDELLPWDENSESLILQWQSEQPRRRSQRADCSPCSEMNKETPADYGQKSGAVRRAAGVAAMTVEQRAMYRRGYQAHAQAVSRWRRRVLQVLRSQLL
jgi:hypothetical protein